MLCYPHSAISSACFHYEELLRSWWRASTSTSHTVLWGEGLSVDCVSLQSPSSKCHYSFDHSIHLFRFLQACDLKMLRTGVSSLMDMATVCAKTMLEFEWTISNARLGTCQLELTQFLSVLWWCLDYLNTDDWSMVELKLERQPWVKNSLLR